MEATSFTHALASRLKEHAEFWDDLGYLHAAATASSIGAHLQDATKLNGAHDRVDRLLYCASIFSQTDEETNKDLAQAIALSVLLTSSDEKARERTAAILAEIGNFPGVDFVQERFPAKPSTFLAALHVRLLRSLNVVLMGTKELALTDFQQRVWLSLPQATATAISAPTSAGKSFLVIEYLCQCAVANENFNAVFVAPTRALLAEVHRKFRERLHDISDVRVSSVPSLDSEQRKKQIFVLTQERLYVLLSIAEVAADIVVVDEAQNLGDSTRGMVLQDCLERLREANSKTQVILLAPGASGFKEAGALLGMGEIGVQESFLSPVLQNRVMVRTEATDARTLHLSLLGPQDCVPVGRIVTKRGMADPRTRLAAAALELGGGGAALVYATGPADAEKVAMQLTAGLEATDSQELRELSDFIARHIHPQYSLVRMVNHGVAFHYGKMPTLLREALEKAFRSGALRYLVCTTTLFQGVNLPARSVFINTPTRGRNQKLDAALLWNFAGRAGRLGQDIVGNVFLVDYDRWEDPVLNQPAKVRVSPALANVVVDHYSDVLAAVRGDMPQPSRQTDTPARIRGAAGLLLARAARQSVRTALDRVPALSLLQRSELSGVAEEAVKHIDLPSRILESNWTVNPFGLARLHNRMREKVRDGAVNELIPIHPGEKDAFQRYVGIFNRIAREVSGIKPSGYGAFVATYALAWMRGQPYPVLINRWIEYRKKRSARGRGNVDTSVRSAFNFIEDVLRFQSVQQAKAYLDILDHVLQEASLPNLRGEVFDYALALELGVSSRSGRAFVELGMSRIAAAALEALYPDSELSTSDARRALQELDIAAVGLSRVIVEELEDLKLLGRGALEA